MKRNKSKMFIGTFVILTTIVGISSADDHCLNGGIYNDQFKKCYHVIPSKQTFNQSSVTCQDVGGRLVSIHSAFEQSLVYGNLKNHDLDADTDSWIGLSYNFNLQQWEWSDDTVTIYTHWENGSAPQDYALKPCVAMRRTKGYWYNTECEGVNSLRYFVCEFDTKPDTEPPDNCAGNGRYYANSGKCVYFMRAITTHENAEKTCHYFNGTLVTIPDNQTHSFILTQNNTLTHDYWIGLMEDENEWTTWTWDNGQNLTAEGALNWDSASGFPLEIGEMRCVAALLRSGKWYNVDCDEGDTFSFMCEMKALTNSSTTLQ